MNEYYLRITDSAAIEVALEDETEYQVTGVITTRGENTTPDEEGGKKVTHKAQFTSHIVLIKGDKIIKGKDKRKWSQKLRNFLFGHDVEYDPFMGWLFAEKMDDLVAEFQQKNY